MKKGLILLKIKIKQNIVGLDFSYIKEQEVSVKKELADDLIKAGYAEEIKLIKSKKASNKKSGDK